MRREDDGRLFSTMDRSLYEKATTPMEQVLILIQKSKKQYREEQTQTSKLHYETKQGGARVRVCVCGIVG